MHFIGQGYEEGDGKMSKNLKILNLNKNTIRIGTDFKDRAHHVKV